MITTTARIKRELVAIGGLRVPKSALSRAMRLMDALSTACEKQGWRFEARPKNATVSYVRVQEIVLEICLLDSPSTGFLRFQVTAFPLGQRTFGDGKYQRVEDLIGNVVASIADYSVRLRALGQRKRELRQARQELKEAQAVQKTESEKLAELEARAAGWDTATQIRALIEALQSGAANLPEEDRLKIERWSKWAEAQAARHDPLTNGYIERVLAWVGSE